MKEAADVKRAAETVESVKAAVDALDAEIAEEVAGMTARLDQTAPLERLSIAPKRGQIEVQFVALAWRPDGPAAGRA